MVYYKQAEINEKLKELTSRLEVLYNKRTSINVSIRELQKNIKYWDAMDLNQCKLFEK